jgi:hypothetical protein
LPQLSTLNAPEGAQGKAGQQIREMGRKKRERENVVVGGFSYGPQKKCGAARMTQPVDPRKIVDLGDGTAGK